MERDELIEEISRRKGIAMEEVAEILRIGRGSAYELIRCGKLHAIRMGRRILVPRSSLESFLENAA